MLKHLKEKKNYRSLKLYIKNIVSMMFVWQ